MAEIHDTENARLQLGSWIVGGAIVAVVVSLIIVTQYATGVADQVALLASITTFLGAVVGVFFGVNASGAANAQNAIATSEATQAAATVADAARSVSETARQATDSAARSIDLSHAAMRQARGLGPDGDLAPGTRSRGLGAYAATRGPAEDDEDVEELSGDPDEAPTRFVIPRARSLALDTFTRGIIHVDSPAPAPTLFGQTVLAVAQAEADAHVSRDTNRPRVTEYLQLLGFPFADASGTPTRYCACGLTWAVAKGYCDLNQVAYTDSSRLAILRSVLGDIAKFYFKPSAGCQKILDDALARHTFLPASKTPSPGHLVFFNWSGHDHAEHIGIVEAAGNGALHTIEFNTTAMDGPNQGNGGAVSRKQRALKFVIGYAATY